MITLTREEAQQILDALQCATPPTFSTKLVEDWQSAVETLRARLAQPEPAPAKSKGALSHEENKQHNKKILDKFYEDNAHLYTAPPQREWQGLTDEEQLEIMKQFGPGQRGLFADAIEAKLKEKNT